MRNCIKYNVELDSLMLLSCIAEDIDENYIVFNTTSNTLTVSVSENDTTTTIPLVVENGIATYNLDSAALKRVSTILVWVTTEENNSTTPIRIITESEIPEDSYILMRLVNGVFYCNGEAKTVVNPDNLPIATTTTVGVVAVGDNLDVTNEGRLSARVSAPERMTNTEIDAICV